MHISYNARSSNITFILVPFASASASVPAVFETDRARLSAHASLSELFTPFLSLATSIQFTFLFQTWINDFFYIIAVSSIYNLINGSILTAFAKTIPELITYCRVLVCDSDIVNRFKQNK